METSAATVPAAAIGTDTQRTAPARSTVLWVVGGLTALGVAIRFSTLGLQSYHHDEVITAARVIPGSFGHMLHEIRASESNPPLYYVLAWGWAKVFGVGEVALRSLSALFGAATVPVAYLIGRELSGRRAGFITAALVAVSPMLIWYSQEARGYALLVFLAALSLLFFARALRTRASRDLVLWALTSALALCTHYFAFFAVSVEAAWLLIAFRSSWRQVILPVAGVAAVGLALVPLILIQANPEHIGWIHHIPLLTRIWESGVAFLIGETGNVIAEPPRIHYALIPTLLVGLAFLLVVMRGTPREKRGAALAAAVGAGVLLLPLAAALVGKDYIESRNLLPAIVPLGVVASIGFASSGARRLGLGLAVALCVYWLAFDVLVTQTPSLQKLDYRTIVKRVGPTHVPRAIVTWKVGIDTVDYYLSDGAQRLSAGKLRVKEVDIISKPSILAGRFVDVPSPFRLAGRFKTARITLSRYVSNRPITVSFNRLYHLQTGFGRNAVLIDGLPAQAGVPRYAALDGGPRGSVPVGPASATTPR